MTQQFSQAQHLRHSLPCGRYYRRLEDTAKQMALETEPHQCSA